MRIGNVASFDLSLRGRERSPRRLITLVDDADHLLAPERVRFRGRRVTVRFNGRFPVDQVTKT